MAVIVVGGAGRGAGKTALVCGLMRALPEIEWTAVKVTTHKHDGAAPIWEETTPGEASDTARYLAAGARRALLVRAEEGELGATVEQILQEDSLRAGGIPSGIIFESNSILRVMRPDVCLRAASSPWTGMKQSYDLVLDYADAAVELAGHDHIIEAEKITFRLASLERVSPVMQEWVREKLGSKD